MSNSTISSLKVYYKKVNSKKYLRAEICFLLPDNSKLQNPDGSENIDFKDFSDSGSNNNVTMRFTELPSSSPSGSYKSIERIAHIQLNNDYTSNHQTIAILNNNDDDKKTATGASYTKDPDKIFALFTD